VAGSVCAITLRTVVGPHGEARAALAADWVRWLEGEGLTPRLLSPHLADPVAHLEGAAGLLLSNGNDVGPAAGGLSPAGESCDPGRDAAELALLDHALAAGLPVLAVCRGLQLVAARFGAALTRVPDRSHVGQHPVTAVGALAAAGEATAQVNSFHTQAVPADGLPGELELLARSDEGYAEAFRHGGRPLWAIQWHPERAGGETPLTRWVVDAWKAAMEEERA
jgi:putative glutamine amidotransferase